MKREHVSNRGIQGFSLIEVMVCIAVIGTVAAVGFVATNNVEANAKRQKLEQDVRQVNTAIQMYHASGGNLGTLSNPAQILLKLMSKADDFSSEAIAGLTGRMIDPRLDVVLQTQREAKTSQPRALWDSTRKQFYIASEGGRGVKEFVLNEALARRKANNELESRDTRSMQLAHEDPWIWDYQDAVASSSALPAPTPVPTTSGGTTPSGGSPGSSGSGTPGALSPPLFSRVSGTFPIEDFNLDLILTNPNPSGSSRVVYSVDGVTWVENRGSTIAIYPDSQIRAYAQSLDASAWTDSSQAIHDYLASDVQLDPPAISTSAPQFDYTANRFVEVTIVSEYNPRTARLEYRLDGGGWQAYTDPLNLNAFDYLDFPALIEARHVGLEPHYLDSAVASSTVLSVETLVVSGASDGSFQNPKGGKSMKATVTNSSNTSFFEWGVPSGSGKFSGGGGDEDDEWDGGGWTSTSTPPNFLRFTDASFSNVRPGRRFLLGPIDYYNGTVNNGTGADSVDLQLSLSFDNGPSRTFTYTLGIINTSNNTGTQKGDADFIQLQQLVSDEEVIIKGVGFRLKIEFGTETTDQGFTTIDQFHVFEDAGAMGKVFGTLIPQL